LGQSLPEVLVYALHGFLGSANDWREVQKFLSPSIGFKAESFFAPGFTQFNFRSEVASKKIFIGYSLGGRLGLKILSQTPGEFDHYIFVSTHPGLADSDSEGRETRAQNDRSWAIQVTENGWESFLSAWNAQGVLKGRKSNPPRALSDYDLQLLRQSLIGDSLALQPDYRTIIQQNNDRLTWVVGSLDAKFKKIAEDMRQSGILKELIEIESGHRVLVDNPRALAQVIESALPSGF
jgi:2-succinyl-6-hydroxy-2,4-cyclohexadiene-1-carboxylate synthase